MKRHIPHDLKTRRFWRHFFGKLFSAVGFFSVVLGLIGVIFPDLLPDGKGWLAAGVVLISVLIGLIQAWPQPIQVNFVSPNMTIRVLDGDLFDQPDHLVIGMCNTFDTSTPEIIQPRSIQGQFLDRIYENDLTRLDKDLSAALQNIASVGEITKEGKQKEYPIGTVAVLHGTSRQYFCLAYTKMNERNEARASIDGIWHSLDNLWRNVCTHANGGVVAMPVIGGGQARISQFLPAQDSIRFIVLSYVLASRREKISDGLNILVKHEDFENLDRLEIQAFLKSMRPS